MFFVVVDGIDGSGKSVVVNEIANQAKKYGKSVFDIRKKTRDTRILPTKYEIDKYDCIVSSEPTWAGAGWTLRVHALRNRQYSPEEIALLFAGDRLQLYRQLIIPLWNSKKIWVQERSVSTSLIYQPLDAKFRGSKLSVEEIKSFPGNKLALGYPPHILVVTDCNPKTALERAKKRQKQDKAFFEELSFQSALREQFKSKQFIDFFKNLGSDVIFLNTQGGEEETKERVKSEILPLIRW